jgi:hypothetical protein
VFALGCEEDRALGVQKRWNAVVCLRITHNTWLDGICRCRNAGSVDWHASGVYNITALRDLIIRSKPRMQTSLANT